MDLTHFTKNDIFIITLPVISYAMSCYHNYMCTHIHTHTHSHIHTHSNVEQVLAAKGESVKLGKLPDSTLDTLELCPEDIMGRSKLSAIVEGASESSEKENIKNTNS